MVQLGVNPEVAGKESLISYFSRSGMNYVGGTIQDLPVGNTEVVAKAIHELTGGKIFQIVPSSSYPQDYERTTEVAQRELRNNARPELATHLENPDDYGVIFLGFPNWWGTMPMPVFTFLEENKFQGKTIAPFCTHEGSGMGRSVDDIRRTCPEAKVLDGLAIRGGDVKEARAGIERWISSVLPR